MGAMLPAFFENAAPVWTTGSLLLFSGLLIIAQRLADIGTGDRTAHSACRCGSGRASSRLTAAKQISRH